MAPKNKKKNAFYFFMREIKEKEARKGCVLTMTQLPKYAHPIWQKLSLVEREPYEEMARQYNKDPNLRGGKLASDGTRVEDNLLEMEEEQRLINKMKQDVKLYCSSDCTTKKEFLELAPKKMFYFMSFNILCQTDEVYIPIEVGIIAYSIEYGIHDQYTKIFYPGQPPTGYAGAAKDESENFHNISVFGEKCSERDLRVIYDDIIKFLNPTGNEEYPPVFCEKNKLPVTVGCLEWICKTLRRENVFQVWDATYLLMELTAGAGKPLPSPSIASDLLNRTSFDYHPSTRCDFHEQIDNHFCALSYSKKLCYMVSDAVCNIFGIPITEKHIPTRAVEEKAYTVHIVKDPKQAGASNASRLDRSDCLYQNSPEESKTPKVPAAPRQPATTCMAAEMSKLQLNITAATLPGHGIGRGIPIPRRN